MRLTRFAIIALLVSTAAPAAKPSPPVGTTAPDIAYVNISGGSRRHYTLRLANEDGTGANSIFSSRDVGQMVPHMGPRADRTILLVQGGKLSLLRYEPTSTGTKLTSIESLPAINTAVGAQQVALSPDGKKYVFFANNDMRFWLFDIAGRAFSPLIQLPVRPHDFAFSRDGLSLVYLDPVSNSEAVLKRVSLTGGDPVEVGIRGDYWDVEPAHQSDAYVLVRGVNTRISRIEYHPAGGGAPVDLAQGYVPSLKCDDGTVIYQQVQPDSSVKLLRVDVTTKSGTTTSPVANYWPDYVGC